MKTTNLQLGEHNILTRNSLRNIFLLSVITFFLPFFGGELILFYTILNCKKNFSSYMKYAAFPLGLLFATFGYSFVPRGEPDILRYFQLIEHIKSSGINITVILQKEKDFLYTRDILLYLISKTDSVHILPWIVGLAIYTISFYVLFDMIDNSSKKFSIKEVFMLVVIMTGIIMPVVVIGNVRCVFAYVVIFFASYRDIIQKKKNLVTLLLYIIPLGLHTSAIVILLLRVIYRFSRCLGKYVIFLAFLIPALIDLSYSLLGNVGGVIGNAISLAYTYLHWTSGGWADEVKNSVSSKISRLYGTFFLVMFSFLCFLYGYRRKNKVQLLDFPLVRYLYLIALCALGCLSITTGAFWRFEAVVVLFSPVYLVPILETERNDCRKIFTVLFLSALFMVILNTIIMIRNNIYLLPTVGNYMYSSGLIILYFIIKAAML